MARPTEMTVWTGKGDEWRHLKIEPIGDRLVLHYRFSRALNEEIKTSCSDAKFNWDTKKWSVKNTARTWYVFDFLSEGPVSSRMYEPLRTFESRLGVFFEHQQVLFNHILTRTDRDWETKPVISGNSKRLDSTLRS